MLIDANIFLEILLEQEKAEKCRKALIEVEKGKEATTTNFTIDSIIIVMNRKKATLSKIKLFIMSILSYKSLRIYHQTLRDRVHALDWMKKYNLDYEDALTLQSAISTGSKEILSFDSDFDKIKEIKRIEP
ncbi:type II toxin-antitoxin system VapC family toxin [Candidatus Pacearchaeota archaeon]|nr:type II toxin-antitoxin system VapC family toxin [Candidatus Pacearchaeota archaeon]